ncbi:aminotransferase class V-fold PLP-dependent enzyme [Nocardiopsis kunsanensis]|uniref:Aminotransferase class V n=1 Tax=Nocardiopsis kunsanensis TaxID=141693 RepID=A0A919CIW7_9ACTN|nr:aminotransferase class V-fold PLP-dependent enzyme [Nocardiopsis kunsanensis]GHD28935.1 aminotransferase class V [Nocardiopsis kunsanensis]
MHEHPAIHRARTHFTPRGTYLDTASHGLLPRTARQVLDAHTEAVATGTFRPDQGDIPTEEARAVYARLNGIGPDQVALSTHVSQLVGTVAASLPEGSEVLAPEREFASAVQPFARHPGLTVREAPLHELAEHVGPATTLVTVSAVQSSDGALAPLQDLARACVDHGARLLVDTTQSAGWLSLPQVPIDYTVCSTYKWLLAPRGTAFLTGTREALAQLHPLAPSWYASEHPWQALYGAGAPPAGDARRLDQAPVWGAAMALAQSLRVIEETGTAVIGAHDIALAERLRAALGLEPAGSAIVSLPVSERAAARVAEAGVATSTRNGRMRVAFHLYNTDEDVDRLLTALD